ncbi:hypothetical protein M422DRAFT_256410 [Sphaerobolus stellatus SS14]|uniref:Uncharacterized protein n=1 Tax=Sphaerobolus stellatus (strain SS14) TaxID=990650 RepID=A0A0C9VH14_SPHS4|nr:hypothetical protein M422DRAFT_256406 [Sphaerobolus stellatus SS14]KIJ40714.1 hypothetical protein M422DRAFT_256410 [Sphaerobolus stellatus SS14]
MSSACPFDGSPPLNTDIAGVGVRISTYVQAFLTIVMMTVSPSLEDIYSQAFLFIIMNISIIASALVVGFSSTPQISLQDAVVAWFFTIIPLIVLHIAGMKLRHRTKLSNAIHTSEWDLNRSLVAMSSMYILSAVFTLIVLHRRETFGSFPECNSSARLFFFGVRKVSHGWFVGMAVVYGIFAISDVCSDDCEVSYSRMFACEYEGAEDGRGTKTGETPAKANRKIGKFNSYYILSFVFTSFLQEKTPPPANINFEADYRWGVIVTILLLIWIAFTELTVAKNHFAPPDGPIWQFGQLFPLFLLACPLFDTSKAVRKFVKDAPKRRAAIAARAQNPQSRVPRAGLFETIEELMRDDPEEDSEENTEENATDPVKDNAKVPATENASEIAKEDIIEAAEEIV